MRMIAKDKVCAFAKTHNNFGSISYLRCPFKIAAQEVPAWNAPAAMRWTSRKFATLKTRWFDTDAFQSIQLALSRWKYDRPITLPAGSDLSRFHP
jgi:hypothetical protein